MAKAMQCDNCGKYFSYKRKKGGILSPKITEANTIAFCLSDENGLLHIENCDVCQDCLKKLFTIMPGLIEGEEK